MTNADFTRGLARSLARPAFLRVPSRLLHWVGGQFADELLLGGQRVLPAKAVASGFVFRHGTLQAALDAILGAEKPPARSA